MLEQSVQDFELILVNDGSTDNSSQICHRYADTDPRIKVIDTENYGPASARNTGIDTAEGKYLSFIDSDDTVQPDFLEKMLNTAERDRTDIVMCRAYAIGSEGTKFLYPISVPSGRVIEGKDVETYLLPGFFIPNKGNGLSPLWNKLYRRSWLESKKIRINEKRVRAEDWLFNLECLIARPRFEIIDEPLYNYYNNENSVMHTLREGEWWQSFESMEILLNVKDRINGNYQTHIAIGIFISVSEFAILLRREGRDSDCNELLRSDKMRKLVRMIPLSMIFKLPRAYAFICAALKLHMPSLAKTIIYRL